MRERPYSFADAALRFRQPAPLLLQPLADDLRLHLWVRSDLELELVLARRRGVRRTLLLHVPFTLEDCFLPVMWRLRSHRACAPGV
jgi:hypothetical protein